MTYREEAITFQCGDEQLLGILSRPGDGVTLQKVVMLIVVGGPQYRAGRHGLDP